MAGPLEGVKVVDMGVWVAGPSSAGILADWGADVIKIEPPTGDPFRGIAFPGGGMPPMFELDNRGKRSISLNLEDASGLKVAQQLIAQADVFVSNMRPRALAKFDLDYEHCAAANPRLIYAEVSAYGSDTFEANRTSYDLGAFWSRAGVGLSLVPAGQGAPPQQRGAMGDHMTGANMAGAVSAALYSRERTGKGQRISVSLFRVGVYMMGWDLSIHVRTGREIVPVDRFHAANPIVNNFQAKDGRWFSLLLLQADRHWPDLLRALEAPHLLEDERFREPDQRRANHPDLIAALDGILATKSYAEWADIFDRENVWFAPFQTLAEVAADPIALEGGAFIDIDTPDGPKRGVATPADFHGTPLGDFTWVPEMGQDTETILLELGYDWDEIVALKDRGAIP